MAYVQSPIPQEQQNQQGPSGTTTPNPLQQMPPQSTQTGGSVGQGGGAAPNASTPGIGTPTQFGSNASKLSDYLAANTDQVKGMGQNIAGTLGTNFNQIQGDVNQAGQDFANTVQAGYAAPNPDLVGKAAADPTGFVKDPNNVKDFQAQLNDTYTGPTSFESTTPYANVQGEVNQAVQGAGLLGSHAGLSSFLNSNVEKNATPGQNTLDTVLLESQPEAIKAVQDAAAPFAGLSDYLGNATKTANALVAPAQAAAKGAASDAQSKLSGVTTPFVQNLNTGYQGAFDKSLNYNKELNDIAQNISNNNYGTLSPEEISLSGFNPALIPLIQQYPNVLPTQAQNNAINFANFFKQGPQAATPTPANTVTPEQISEYQALGLLSGNELSGLNFTMPSEAGTPFSMPSETPQYNNEQAGTAINQVYDPMYQQLIANNWSNVSPDQKQKLTDYMTSLQSFLGMTQPSPQPVNPEPPTPPNQPPGTGKPPPGVFY